MRPALIALSLLCAVPLACAQQPARPPASAPAKLSTVAKAKVIAQARERSRAALHAVSAASTEKAAADAQTLFDQLIFYAPEVPEALAEADLAVRLLTLVQGAPEQARAELIEYFLKHEDLARTLAFLIKPQDKPKSVCAVLSKLKSACADQPGEFPALAAAICVVHDRTISAKAAKGEQRRTIDPVEVFRFYASNDSKLVFSTRTLPPELALYLVDSTAEIPELEWALSHYAGNRNPGKLFGSIVYDTAALKFSKPKKIAALPYTLENIQRVGGVCEEQAYFASNVGKAIGVPSVMIDGRDAVMSHAWDGLLFARGTAYTWVLDEGCFGDYKKLRGNTADPQTGLRMAAQELNLLAMSLSVPEKDRYAAIACADAAKRVAALSKRNRPDWPPKPPEGLEGVTPGPTDMSGAMVYLEKAVKLAPTSPAVWSALSQMARDMNDAQRVRWSEALLRACDASPDFIHRMMGLMIAGLENPPEEAKAWAWVVPRYTRRADLRVEAMMAQGAALEKAGDKAGAFACYQEIADKLVNDAPEAVNALERAEALLKSQGKGPDAVTLYGGAFHRVARPASSSPGAFSQSNFYQIGARYAELLEDAGRTAEAKTVRAQIKAGEEKAKG